MTKKMRQYLSGNLEGLSEEDIKHCQWKERIHRDPLIKIDGITVGVVTGFDIKLNRDPKYEVDFTKFPLTGKLEFKGNFLNAEIDQTIIDELFKDDEDENNN